MRVHHFVVAMVAVTVASLPAAAGFAAHAAPAFNDPVRITNTSCHLDYLSVSHQYKTIVFPVINNGSVAHGFDISARFKSGLVKPHQETTLVAHFASPGTYAYACVAAHSTVKKGVFTIRR